MTEEIRGLIRNLNFKEAFDEINEMPTVDLGMILVEMAHEKSDIRPYTFVLSLIAKDPENSKWHYLASLLLSQPLCHLTGAYETSYYHAQRAELLSPEDMSLKEYLLFFYIIPDRLLDDREAIRISQAILEIDANNQTALSTLVEHEKRTGFSLPR